MKRVLVVGLLSFVASANAGSWTLRVKSDGMHFAKLAVHKDQLVAAPRAGKDPAQPKPPALMTSDACGKSGKWTALTPAPPAGAIYFIGPTPGNLMVMVFDEKTKDASPYALVGGAWKPSKGAPHGAPDTAAGGQGVYLTGSGEGEGLVFSSDGLTFKPLPKLPKGTYLEAVGDSLYVASSQGGSGTRVAPDGTPINQLPVTLTFSDTKAAGKWILWDRKISNDGGLSSHDTPINPSMIIGKPAAVGDQLAIHIGNEIQMTKDGVTWTKLPLDGLANAKIGSLYSCGGELLMLSGGDVYAYKP